ncbi:hypothetical protein EGCR1_17505 (plasmid) [Enterococcus gilvus]|uniref:hypothetical protein n=1 Tax=Enterococcus gilvus TaxID=160453 RepID=UPI000DF61FF9|nr:hypothetical protein [Enterococcus gilvus]AXG40498.1 hypothetical protein EGCR1_17505 [Enterococcus gilvus]
MKIKLSKRVFFGVVLFLILFPIKYDLKDGGSIAYQAIGYEVIFWNGLKDEKKKATGCTIQLFGTFEVYDSYKMSDRRVGE